MRAWGRVAAGFVLCGMLGGLQAQQPAGVAEALQGLTSEPATHTGVTFDRDMLQALSGTGAWGGSSGPVAGLNSITVDNYRFHEHAFYVPEAMHGLIVAYRSAGWKHLVDQNAGPAQSASPVKPLSDLWLHFSGANIDAVTVLLRGPRQMSVIEVTGTLKPLDMVHLSGHLGIPRIDPGAVMVPEK